MSAYTPLEHIRGNLRMIRGAVADFGSALGASDRGFGGATLALEKRGNDNIAQAFRNAPELQTLLPKLWAECSTGRPLEDSGYAIMDELRLAERQLPPLVDGEQ